MGARFLKWEPRTKPRRILFSVIEQWCVNRYDSGGFVFVALVSGKVHVRSVASKPRSCADSSEPLTQREWLRRSSLTPAYSRARVKRSNVCSIRPWNRFHASHGYTRFTTIPRQSFISKNSRSLAFVLFRQYIFFPKNSWKIDGSLSIVISSIVRFFKYNIL